MQRERMYRAGKFLAQQSIHQLVTFDLGQSGEGLGNGDKFEMRVRCRSRVHMTFVMEFEVAGLQCGADFLRYLAFYLVTQGHDSCLQGRIGRVFT